MKLLFFLKTLPWHLFSSLKKKTRKGAMILFTVFFFFVFSALGLSLIHISRIHLKISAFKKQSTFLEYAAENGIKQGFNNFLNLLSQTSSPSILYSEQLDQLKEDIRTNGTKIIEEVLGQKLPIQTSGNWENLSWEITTQCFPVKIIDKENYFQTIYKLSINSKGKLKNFKHKRKATFFASLGVLAGHIPLSLFPLLIDKKLEPEEKENYAEKNKISFLSSKKNQLPPQISFAEKELIPQEATSELSKALKTKFFYPQDISTAKLRAILGLEETEEPVPDGVYLIKDDLGLGGIYVQGDVEEMVLAIEEDFQFISFRTEKGVWILKYSPSKSKTFFSSPEETLFFDLIPLGIIVINGKVKSLGGGVVDSSGKVTLVKDREVPSLLQGIQLSIVSSDEITISSHLILQGVKWQESVPYVKDSNSQLIIFSTGKGFWDEQTTEGGITIDKSSPEEIKVQAMLTASGKGFTIEGKGKKTQILGSLQASNYVSNENTLEIVFDDRLFEESNFPQNTPATTKPVLFISFFKVLEWEEF